MVGASQFGFSCNPGLSFFFAASTVLGWITVHTSPSLVEAHLLYLSTRYAWTKASDLPYSTTTKKLTYY